MKRKLLPQDKFVSEDDDSSADVLNSEILQKTVKDSDSTKTLKNNSPPAENFEAVYENRSEHDFASKKKMKYDELTDAILKKYSIEKEKIIKEGEFGEIWYCLYEGDRPTSVYQSGGDKPNLLQLIGDKKERRCVILKKANNIGLHEIMNEIEIYEYLMKEPTIALDQRKHPQAVILREDNICCLILQYIYCYQPKGKPSSQSMDVSEFIKMVRKIEIEKLKITTNENFMSLFNIIMLGMYEAQYQLHQLNVLHLDSACRNFAIEFIKTKPSIFGIRILDFNLSVILDDKGMGLKDARSSFPSQFYDSKTLYAMNSCDQKKLFDVSIHTDLFAMRAVIIEAFGQLLGMSCNEIFDLSSASDEDELQSSEMYSKAYWAKWSQRARNMSDEERLLRYLNNVIKCADNSNKIHSKFVKEIIKYYSPYLSKMSSHQDKSHLLKEDSEMFMKCYQNLRNKVGSLDQDEIGNLIQSLIEAQTMEPCSTVVPTTHVPIINPFTLFTKTENLSVVHQVPLPSPPPPSNF